jgi:hypothetical protein
MADSSILLKRIEAASIITITDATPSDLVLKAVEPGTLKWARGGHVPLEWWDRDVLQVPLRGRAMPCPFELSVKYTGAQAATDVFAFLAKETTTGLMYMFSVAIKIPTNKDAAAGEIITLGSFYIPDGGLEVEAGQEFDILRIRGKANVAEPTVTTY